MDRRTMLKATAALPLAAVIPSNAIAGENDRIITKLVDEHFRIMGSLDKLNCIPEDTMADALNAAYNIERTLGDMPADTLTGVREKARWLRCDENRDFGDFGKNPVLLSLFDDIERLT